jgi:hypothetical protein
MDNKIIKQIVNKSKNKMQLFSRKTNNYRYMNVKNYKSLKPLTYTILIKPSTVITKINGKIETKQNLDRGDYVICGVKGEKYGLKLEKILDIYDIGNIENKKVERYGFKLTSKKLKEYGLNTNKKIEIVPSWGGKQILQVNDYILLENNGTGKYGIDSAAFKKTYN